MNPTAGRLCFVLTTARYPFKLSNETMRYFGELEEQEAAAHIYAVYNIGKEPPLDLALLQNKVVIIRRFVSITI